MASAPGNNVILDKKIKDLENLKESSQKASLCISNNAQHEDAIIFIGSTKSGKSSLINYLIENKLIGKKVESCRPISIIKANSLPGPQIGMGPTSETVYPSRWYSKKLPGFALWDAPGFDDNRGAVQDIANAFFINELFKNIKSAKIVLVTDINDIACDNIKPFLILLSAVEKILKDKMKECFDGIAIIFSKVPKEISKTPVDKKYINQLLEEQFLSSNAINISEPAKDLIRHLIKNDQKIGIFKQAILGDVTDLNINLGIVEAIQNSSNIQELILKKMQPSIADGSKAFLWEVRKDLTCMEEFVRLQNLVDEYYKTRMETDKNNSTSTAVLNNDAKIKKEVQDALTLTKSNENKIMALMSISDSIKTHIQDSNLVEKARFLEFIDQLLHSKESRHIDVILQKVVDSNNCLERNKLPKPIVLTFRGSTNKCSDPRSPCFCQLWKR